MNKEQIDEAFNTLMIRMLMIDKRTEEFQTELLIFFQEGIIKGQDFMLKKLKLTKDDSS